MVFGEKFLACPDLFPAHHAGAFWGAGRIAIDLAGGPYEFRGLAAAQEAFVRRRFGPLCRAVAEPAVAALTVEVFQAAPGDFLSIDTKGWEYTFDLAYEPRTVRVAGHFFMGRLDWNPALSAALWTDAGDEPDFQPIFENLLRVLAAYRLLECGGVLLHSAAICDVHKGYVFFGPSGAGKSTIARLGLRSGRRVMSDDLNALAPARGGFAIERVPFAGDLGQVAVRDGSAALAGMFRLRHGTAVAARPMSKAEAFAALWACAPFVNADPHRFAELDATLTSLIESVPVGTLTFSRDTPFHDLIAVIQRTAS